MEIKSHKIIKRKVAVVAMALSISVASVGQTAYAASPDVQSKINELVVSTVSSAMPEINKALGGVKDEAKAEVIAVIQAMPGQVEKAISTYKNDVINIGTEEINRIKKEKINELESVKQAEINKGKETMDQQKVDMINEAQSEIDSIVANYEDYIK